MLNVEAISPMQFEGTPAAGTHRVVTTAKAWGHEH